VAKQHRTVGESHSRKCCVVLIRKLAISAYVLAMLALLWEITRLHQQQPVIIGHALRLGGDSSR
jgi:hypothetical protein